MIPDHSCSLELQEYQASALVQTAEALLTLTSWKAELFLYLVQFFYFFWPCWVTADSRQGRTPAAHWSSAESLLHAVNTCHLG